MKCENCATYERFEEVLYCTVAPHAKHVCTKRLSAASFHASHASYMFFLFFLVEGCFDWLALMTPPANHVFPQACGMCLRRYFTYVRRNFHVHSLHMALIGFVETASQANATTAAA